ncbi:uncharacterized protein DSM5745_03530 [Aspergillus mulundensis]|uniref:Uncharacterized protein n=1 Tax=Aspergillus mulundensis TaxID=1810919 RepID=A0A3D8SM58_9EURO|nr:hypothetical protein DSM5745_03530 [Aspergillus mulundensis]RDW86888.1 hypothetical protein DSM5745_03530 [Aspergillus mulundensis]
MTKRDSSVQNNWTGPHCGPRHNGPVLNEERLTKPRSMEKKYAHENYPPQEKLKVEEELRGGTRMPGGIGNRE